MPNDPFDDFFKEALAGSASRHIAIAIGDLISYEEINHCTTFLVANLPRLPHNGFPLLDQSPLSVLEAVARRIQLCRTLDQRLSYDFEKRDLKMYLLLTCFDLLGQPADWLDFGGWLRSKAPRHVAEKERVVGALEGSLSPIDMATILYTGYNEIYGVKSAFFRFIFEILPDEARGALFGHINMVKLPYWPRTDDPSFGTDKEKAQWLYRTRNAYTHRGNVVRGVEDMPPGLEHEWLTYRQEYGAKGWTTALVREWPNVLMTVVQIGLATYLRALPRPERPVAVENYQKSREVPRPDAAEVG